jgi:hypothetical protein
VRADEVHEERVERADLRAVTHGAGKVLGDAVAICRTAARENDRNTTCCSGFQPLQGPGGLEQRNGGLAAARAALDQQLAVRVEDG